MLRGKGGCSVTESGDGITVCPNGKQKGDVPNVQWFVGVAFGFVEMYVFFPCLVLVWIRLMFGGSVGFVLTGLLVWKEDRETKVMGGTSYA